MVKLLLIRKKYKIQGVKAISSQIIDVLIAIDSNLILQTPKYSGPSNAENPIWITDPNLIYMITRQANALSGQAGNELQIKAKVKDVIRWRESTLSLKLNSEVVLYDFVTTTGVNLFSMPRADVADAIIPLPDPNNILHPKIQTVEDFYWHSDMLKAGDVVYHFKFIILDASGNVKGYYAWDPFIHITPS